MKHYIKKANIFALTTFLWGIFSLVLSQNFEHVSFEKISLHDPLGLIEKDKSSIEGVSLTYCACPADNPEGRELLTKFLTYPRLATPRNQMGLPALNPSDLRVLQSPNDDTACNILTNEFRDDSGIHEDRREAYYRLGDYYFATFTFIPPPPDELIVGIKYVIVFDSELNKIDGVGLR